MKIFDKIIDFFTKKPFWQYALVIIFSLSWFGFLQVDDSFADPDAFYHAKMPLIIAEQGAATVFPWLSATTLAYSYTDHHFLFHLLLIPFVLASPLIGLKVATVLFSSSAVVAFFWLLRRLKITGAFFYALLLLLSNPFVFRLSLAKSQALALILLFVLIYCIFHKKYLALIILSCLYVWSYAGWPLALALALIYWVISFIWSLSRGLKLNNKISRLKIISQGYLIFVSVVLGLACGLFFSPYFPVNLNFYWQQTFQIAILNYQHLIGVGGEWYPMALGEWFLQSPAFIGVSLMATILFVINIKKQSVQSWFLAIVAFLFFILTLKSRRYIEYAVPVMLLFSASSFHIFWQIIKKDFPSIYQSKLAKSFLALLLILVIGLSIYESSATAKELKNGFAFDSFAGPSQWLKDNSLAGDIVFHTNWDIFPMLFYHNHQNYYLVGLDPTFMYLNDKDLHQRWVKIIAGEDEDYDIYQNITELFKAKFVLVKLSGHESFDNKLSQDPRFELKYSDSEAKVYQIIR